MAQTVERNRCPECSGNPGSSLACLDCGRLLEEAEGSNHHARLGLDHLADFDAAEAERRYLALSRVLHPDFQTKSDDATRDLALRNSALLNEAWRVLTDDQLRAEYLLELHHPGALEQHKQLSPAFLMEAMEMSEELDNARNIGCNDTIQLIAERARTEIAERMQGVASACAATILRIARDDHRPEATRPTRLVGPHTWNSEQIAVLLHQARVYRRILRDTEAIR